MVGIIDFSGIAIGDPACDLVIAWTFFKNNSRKIFQENLNFDEETWMRAKGWALWKAAIELIKISNRSDVKFSKNLAVVESILL